MDRGKKEICVTLALHCFPFGANLDVTHLLRVNTNSIVNKGQGGMPNFNKYIKEELLGAIVYKFRNYVCVKSLRI